MLRLWAGERNAAAREERCRAFSVLNSCPLYGRSMALAQAALADIDNTSGREHPPCAMLA